METCTSLELETQQLLTEGLLAEKVIPLIASTFE